MRLAASAGVLVYDSSVGNAGNQFWYDTAAGGVVTASLKYYVVYIAQPATSSAGGAQAGGPAFTTGGK